MKSRHAKQPKNLPTPPNGVWLHDNVFIDETEIATIHWLEFTAYLGKDSSATDSIANVSFAEEVPWQLGKQKIYIYKYSAVTPCDDISEDNYLFYPGYRYFPVVGITHKQAMAYCRWRSAAINKKYVWPNAGDTLGVYFNFRLPTEKEWEMAAYGSRQGTKYGLKEDSIELDSKLIRKTKNVVRYRRNDNFRPNFVCRYQFNNKRSRPLYAENVNILSYIYGSMPNSLNLYNMIGNVAEMIDRDSIAKGGSWLHSAEECKISNRQYYDCPTEWLGFRCVCDVHVYKKRNPPIIKSPDGEEEHCQLVRETLIPELALKKRQRIDQERREIDREKFEHIFGSLDAEGITIYLNDSIFNESKALNTKSPEYVKFDFVTSQGIRIDTVEILSVGYGESAYPRSRTVLTKHQDISYHLDASYNPIYLMFVIKYRTEDEEKSVTIKRYLEFLKEARK